MGKDGRTSFGDTFSKEFMKEHFGHWYNWINPMMTPGMPTGTVHTDQKIGDEYQDISFQGINPFGEMIAGDFDWKKAWEGAKTGASWGGGYSPGWGHLVGGLIGAGMGGMWVGDENQSESGLAMASQGKAEGAWGEGNDTWKALNTAVGLFNSIYGGKGSTAGSTEGKVGGLLNKFSWNNNSYGLGDLMGLLPQGNTETTETPVVDTSSPWMNYVPPEYTSQYSSPQYMTSPNTANLAIPSNYVAYDPKIGYTSLPRTVNTFIPMTPQTSSSPFMGGIF